MSTIKDYKEKIGDQLKDVDIAMLFLNAGVLTYGWVVDQSLADI
jgi:hypothetical protein